MNYWDKIRKRLQERCVTAAEIGLISVARHKGLPLKANALWEFTHADFHNDHCQLCGAAIGTRFWLHNRVSDDRLFVGSKCIHNYELVDLAAEDIVKQVREVSRARRNAELYSEFVNLFDANDRFTLAQRIEQPAVQQILHSGFAVSAVHRMVWENFRLDLPSPAAVYRRIADGKVITRKDRAAINVWLKVAEAGLEAFLNWMAFAKLFLPKAAPVTGEAAMDVLAPKLRRGRPKIKTSK